MGARSSSRRSFMKLAAAAPLLSQIAVRNLYAQAATGIGKDPRQNVYTRLGVKTVINCRGTWTFLSGSLEFPEVREAQAEAAGIPCIAFKYAENTGQFQQFREQAGTFSDSIKLWGAS